MKSTFIIDLTSFKIVRKTQNENNIRAQLNVLISFLPFSAFAKMCSEIYFKIQTTYIL